MDKILFSDAETLWRTLIIGVGAYVALVALLRIAGKRTLAKLNAFDLVVTVALGSMLASALLNKDVALAQVALAFALLILLQFSVTWSSVRVPWIRRILTGEPTLLLHRGVVLPDAMRRARISREELDAAARAAGASSLHDLQAIVLETDGTVSVIRRGADEATIIPRAS